MNRNLLNSLALAAAGCVQALTNAAVMPPGATAAPAIETPAEARQVVRFWKGAGPALWFAKDEDFDRLFREHFLTLYEAAARGDLGHWTSTPDGSLALIILLDQYPRNSFRGRPRMYATDAAARGVADQAIAAGHDRAVAQEMQLFFYLPFAHSENLADQERAVTLCKRLGEPNVSRAMHHRDIVKRFGRFPHRNPILGRRMTAEEQAYLDNGGYKG